ncbi:GNAT family N-acetyltransferase [Pseudomonas sp. 5P_3.1_Bac2]|uniref:GNAT family N-acetyltransferase n=1 Tax=Pseudomonas sp. 5P_3.1_Bac2 TaxID=2971617 RepID=UPI0021CA917D|nr:GNAT family N-acetyltransferase [Pseudomonas sp. 5P_3.1_Bac2]MCU1719657.1 GNAT family N-acetyltransferase [Pseudomonas sp. 5P_3.1_Bac2]
MKLRPATDIDRPTLFELHREAFYEHITQLWGWDENWQRTKFAEEFTDAVTSVIEIGEKIAGYVQIVDKPNQIYVLNIAISRAFQGQGIGTQILRELQQKATAEKVPLELSVFRPNASALKFYKRLGFIQTGETDTHIKMYWGS